MADVFNGSVNMAGLRSGSFGLCANVNQNKSYVHLKLTDSAFRAFEDYTKIKVRQSTRKESREREKRGESGMEAERERGLVSAEK